MNDSLSETRSPQSGGKELPAGTHLEEFLIERVLGSGGFGITYLALDTSLGRQVVIKENLPSQFAHRDTRCLTVHPGTCSEDQYSFRWSMENFSKESAMLASLRHPGIVPVLRRFEAFGTAYFVMPFVEGSPFDSLIEERTAENNPFSEDELRVLLERALGALDHLHQRGIYHRDIKPANILVTDDGIPVLIDFGSARQRLSERSMTVIESAGYTPFEQLQSRGNVGPWSDLYALGGSLEKALTGQTPPKAMDRMLQDPRIPLAERPELCALYSIEFLSSIDKSLQFEVADRWQDAGEWLAALRRELKQTKSPAVSVRHARATAPEPELTETTVSSEFQSKPGVKNNALLVRWGIAACILLGLIVSAKSIFNNKEMPKEGVTTETEAQTREANERLGQERAAKMHAEQRADQAEKEKQILIAQAKDAEIQRATRAEQQQALMAKAEAEAVDKQLRARVEQEQQALVAKTNEQALAKAEMSKSVLTSSKAGDEEDLLETYTAVLSERDHYNSSGARLDNAAAIIRQDRANFHKFNKRDGADQSDKFFVSSENRDKLEQLLNRGQINNATMRAIVDKPTVATVQVYRSASGETYIKVNISE